MLLSGSNYVEFLIGLFVLKENTDDIVYKKNHLSFLYDLKERKIDKHNFILENLSLPLFEFWKIEGIDFNFSLFEEVHLLKGTAKHHYNQIQFFLTSYHNIFPPKLYQTF